MTKFGLNPFYPFNQKKSYVVGKGRNHKWTKKWILNIQEMKLGQLNLSCRLCTWFPRCFPILSQYLLLATIFLEVWRFLASSKYWDRMRKLRGNCVHNRQLKFSWSEISMSLNKEISLFQILFVSDKHNINILQLIVK